MVKHTDNIMRHFAFSVKHASCSAMPQDIAMDIKYAKRIICAGRIYLVK